MPERAEDRGHRSQVGLHDRRHRGLELPDELSGTGRAHPALEAVVQAAIEVSDNAAADALLEHVGPEAVDAFARRQGLSEQDPSYPLLGEDAAWTRDPGWARRPPAGRARRARQLAGQVTGREISTDVPPVDRQRWLAAVSLATDPGFRARARELLAEGRSS